MKQKSGPGKAPAEQVLKDIPRQTRRHYSAEDKILIFLEGCGVRRTSPSSAVDLALQVPELSPRGLAVRFTDRAFLDQAL